MRALVVSLIFAAFLGGLGVTSARADHVPNYVVPGRPDVPVMINGYDASWGVVEGDWGLYRPGHVAPTVIPAPYAAPPGRAPRYFPSLGGLPYSGRLEVEPPANRALPPAAESFHRSWSAGSDPSLPATEYAPSPPIIYAPSDSGRRRRHHHNP